MTTAVRLDWDAWRASYDELGCVAQAAFYNDVYQLHPEQHRFSTKALGAFLDRIGDPVSVIELGGWTGGFAAEMLADTAIRSWTNYEISSDAALNPSTVDPRYQAVALARFFWEGTYECDLFVASHVIEHLKLKDLEATFDAVNCRFVYLQAPLSEGPTDWSGYHGSHILEVGWDGVSEALGKRGFWLVEPLSVPHVRCFER